jgi:hypothetical protein
MRYFHAEGNERSREFKVRTQEVLRGQGGLAPMQRLIFHASYSVSGLPQFLSERHSSIDPVGLASTLGFCWRRRVCLDGLCDRLDGDRVLSTRRHRLAHTLGRVHPNRPGQASQAPVRKKRLQQLREDQGTPTATISADAERRSSPRDHFHDGSHHDGRDSDAVKDNLVEQHREVCPSQSRLEVVMNML